VVPTRSARPDPLESPDRHAPKSRVESVTSRSENGAHLFQQLQQEFSRVNESRATAEARASEQREVAENLRQDNDRIRDELRRKDAEISALRDDIRSRDSAYASLKEECERVLDELQGIRGNQEEHQEGLAFENDEMRATLQSLEREHAAAMEELSTNREQMHRMETDMHKALRTQQAALDSERKVHEKLVALTDMLEAKSRENKGLQHELTALKRKYERAEGRQIAHLGRQGMPLGGIKPYRDPMLRLAPLDPIYSQQIPNDLDTP